MKKSTALIVTAAALTLVCAVLLIASVLSPVSVQAASMHQEQPQVLGTFSAPILRRPGLLRLPTATPTPRLAIVAPIQVAPSLLTRVAPRLRNPNEIGRVIRPLFTPEVIWVACGDTLPMFEAVRANAPEPDKPCTFIIEGQPGKNLLLTARPLVDNMTLDSSLTDDSGQLLDEGAAGSPDNGAFLNFTVPPSGQAILRIVASTSGPFEMRVSVPFIPYSITFCGGNLNYGQQVHHLIPVAEAQCSYTFMGQAGDAVVITMDREREDTNLDPLLELRDTSATILTSNNDTEGSVNALLSYVLPAGGKYTIVARDYDNSNTGPYLLSLSLAPSPSETPTPTPPPPSCGGAVSIGSSITGRIAMRGAECVYTLFGTKDKTVTLTLAKTDGGLDTYLELYPSSYPSGSRLAYNDDSSVAGGLNSQIASYTFPSTASYRVVVSAYADNSTGSYKLTASQP